MAQNSTGAQSKTTAQKFRQILEEYPNAIEALEQSDDVRANAIAGSISKLAGDPLPDGFVYAIKSDDGFVKIGKSKNPEQRLQSISTGNPTELELIAKAESTDSRSLEREMHKRFADKRERGEWFDLSFDEQEELIEVLEDEA